MTGSDANGSTVEKIRDRKLIFVSYASPDRASAERLVSEIEGHGIPCWMAPRDVPGGANWGKAILDAIEAAEIFVVLLSGGANQSVHVTNEIERAATYRKTIVPLRIENIMPSREIEFHISARHWVDLFEGPQKREQNMRRFMDVLRDVLREWLVPDLAPLGEAHPAPVHLTPPARIANSIELPANTSIPVIAAPTISNSEVRKAILADFNRVSVPEVQALAVPLYRRYGATLIPELCLMLGEEEFRFCGFRRQLFGVVSVCAAQPTARAYSNMVFTTMLDHLQKGGTDLIDALEVIKKLSIQRTEKWKALFDAFPSIHAQYGWRLIPVLLETVPPADRNDLCRALVEIIHIPDQERQEAAIDGIRQFNYRMAIPDLRDLVEMTSNSKVAAKASKCLEGWHDADSGPSIRKAIAACNDSAYSGCPYWCELANCLNKLEGPTAAEFLVEQFLNLTEEQQSYALYGFWEGFKSMNSKLITAALERLTTSAGDAKLREIAGNRLAELGGGA